MRSALLAVAAVDIALAEGCAESGGETTRDSESARCDENYGGCVPVASDVDCAGGSGDGPAYTDGPVRVRGYDPYGLDADGDGYGCD